MLIQKDWTIKPWKTRNLQNLLKTSFITASLPKYPLWAHLKLTQPWNPFSQEKWLHLDSKRVVPTLLKVPYLVLPLHLDTS
ncbi:Hypothetical predicted protein [Cloeon dipterum]|uniref:Uncharacterized protein n=1 Tax=Cloeon dipterum TaxID=197152 RepID=A0A8S1BZW3_9INSE|nr:Hypothetical predicted protein [Cloeon dipterum]